MKKAVKIIVGLIIIAFVVIQFFPVEENMSAEMPKADFILVNDTPEPIANQIRVSCYDCHSNNTTYPWYSNIQPFSWYLEKHIKEGKEELNFSEWNTLSKRRKRNKLNSIISQIKNNEMPLGPYTLIHTNAKLSEKNKERLEEWLTNLKDNL